MSSLRVSRRLAALTAAVAALSLVAPQLALALAPVVVLAALLLSGRYPGERVIEGVRAQRYAQLGRQRAASVSWPRPRPRPRRVGRATAFALAVRPPPSALASA